MREKQKSTRLYIEQVEVTKSEKLVFVLSDGSALVVPTVKALAFALSEATELIADDSEDAEPHFFN